MDKKVRKQELIMGSEPHVGLDLGGKGAIINLGRGLDRTSVQRG